MAKEKIYILSHTDLDGYFSAGLVQHYCTLDAEKRNVEVEFKHKSWTYGWDIPNLDTIKKNYDKVFIVDLCLPFDFMFAIWEKFKKNFIWIDHHIKPDNLFLSQFANYPKGGYYEVRGLRETQEHTSSAAKLVYKYFDTSGNDVPGWLAALSDFDCWNRKNEEYWKNTVMPFFSYMQHKVCSPANAYDYIENRVKENFFYDDKGENLRTWSEIDTGRIMYDDMKAFYNSDAKRGFARTFETYNSTTKKIKTLRAWVCNTQHRSSIVFEDLPDRDKYDVFIPYHFNGEKYMYSMYTFKEDVHCNEVNVLETITSYLDGENIVNTTPPKRIVLSFNGHKDAAGANSEKFVFA